MSKVIDKRIVVEDGDKTIWEITFETEKPVDKDGLDVGCYVSVMP